MTTSTHAPTEAPGPTALPLIHELWADRQRLATLPLIHELWASHQHACPYVRHDERGCYCTSPLVRDSADPYMPCDPAPLQLWCLTEAEYVKCCLYPAGDAG